MARPAISPVVWLPPKARTHQANQEGYAFQLERIEVPGFGPEDVAVHADGSLFTGLLDGRILRVSAHGKRIDVVAQTAGRPLGIELYPDGSLLVCDAYCGLLRVDPATGVITTLVREVAGAAMRFCNNAALAQDGTIFFSDSSRRHTFAFWMADIFEHSGTGRLLRRSPRGEVVVLLDGLQFANGVALAPDESFVAVAETGAYRVRRYWLSGPRAGTSDMLIEGLGGFPDNLSTGSDGLIWVTQTSPRSKPLDFLHRRHPVLRKLAWALPDTLKPMPVRTVWMLGIDAQGHVQREILQPGHHYHMVTGVREHQGALYLGSLSERALAVLRRAPS